MLMHNGREHDERDRDRDYRRDEYDRRGEREHYGRRAEYRGNVDFAMTSGRPRREERREWDDEYGEAPELTPELAKRWTKSMQNADGSAGAHWTQEQTTQVMTQRGYHYDPATWHAIMCAMYSDFCEVAKKTVSAATPSFMRTWRTLGSMTRTPSRTRPRCTTAM